ncbi:hypothetical protein ACHAXA_006947 [Cyclostephanos tholiformis]|jgi:WD40 repeat protein|uniref:Guanine nucleotide-binding protein subunit beta-like protein n=1 Tax=Cyclostephanos tholiformis TaxID=382380 RepID=A0ABD3R5I7_9STRA
MSVVPTDYLVPKDYGGEVEGRSRATLGFAALDIVRNYCGADTVAGNEVVVASQLGGRVCVWVRLDHLLIDKGVTIADDDHVTTTEECIRCIRSQAEFTVNSAIGNTVAIRPPSLANYYPRDDTDLLVALGCANGAVVLCKTSILAARPGVGAGSYETAVVGDSSSSSTTSPEKTVIILSKSTPGEIVATIGGGHACVMSLAFHPTIPNSFVVGRKDGTIDIYSSATVDHFHTTGDLSFRRMHRFLHSSFPVRALAFSQPDGALLFAGDDYGKLYSYDVSCNNARTNMSAPVKLVACAQMAHHGWVMNLTPFPDGKRVATCGSDRSVKVWDCGMGLASSTPVHSFEGVHDGLVWGLDCGHVVDANIGRFSDGRSSGDKLKLISCGNDGVVQVFSCSE